MALARTYAGTPAADLPGVECRVRPLNAKAHTTVPARVLGAFGSLVSVLYQGHRQTTAHYPHELHAADCSCALCAGASE